MNVVHFDKKLGLRVKTVPPKPGVARCRDCQSTHDSPATARACAAAYSDRVTPNGKVHASLPRRKDRPGDFVDYDAGWLERLPKNPKTQKPVLDIVVLADLRKAA